MQAETLMMFIGNIKDRSALNKNGEPIEGGYAGISLADYHYPKFHDTDDWKTATELSFEPDAITAFQLQTRNILKMILLVCFVLG